MTEDATEIEHKVDADPLEPNPLSMTSQSPQSHHSSNGTVSARSGSAAGSILESNLKELEGMSASIDTLKSAYTEQMDKKRAKCTDLTALEQHIGDRFECIMTEFTQFRRKQAAYGQDLQSKICELHDLGVAIESEQELEAQSLEQVRSLLHQHQSKRKALRMAQNMATRCSSKMEEFAKGLAARHLHLDLFVQNEDLSLDDVDVAEYQKLLRFLEAFGSSKSNDSINGNDDGDGLFAEDSVSTMVNMVMAVDAVGDIKCDDDAPSIKGVQPPQDLTECILKAKEMRKDHEIIALRAQLSKQQQANRSLHAENERLTQQSNEQQVLCPTE